MRLFSIYIKYGVDRIMVLTMEKQVAIIGAGISGLTACKYCKSKGFHPTVFESQGSIGGVWRKTIRTTKLQTPKPFYQFSDLPWQSSVTEDFPTQTQVFEYLQSYATHFDLLKHIRFDSHVISISYEGPSEAEMQAWSLWGGTGRPFSSKGKWNVTVQDTQTLSTEVCQMDFVILCFGKFSNLPNIPEFPPNKGPEVFQGKVMHSSDYAAMDNANAAELIREKRVAIVGLQKSALDIAMECSTANGVKHPCTVVYRTEHWGIPYFLPWGIPILYPYLNRFSELMVHKPGESLLLGFLATILSPLRWGISKFIERHITSKYRLAKFGMVPKHSFAKEVNSCTIAIMPEDFYDRVDQGSIKLKKAQKFCFSEKGILFDSEVEPVNVDMVILATGFKYFEKLKHIFVNPAFRSCISGSPDRVLGLYRECIHPRIPQLAVIGFSEGISNLHTSEMSCRWLAELLDGTFDLPSIKAMEEDVATWDIYMKKYSGEYSTKWCIGGLQIWYNDQVCKDMGWNPKRKRGLIAELFEPYGPLDYVQL